MTIPHEAVESATKALWQYYDGPEDGQIIWDSPEDIQEEIDSYRDAAIDALTAALPILEQQIREEIAKRIESDCEAEEPLCYGCWNAAQIARGEQA